MTPPDQPAAEAPGVRFDDVRWLYDADYYDGPLSGMVESASAGKLWAHCISGDPLEDRRVYELRRLANEAMAAEAARYDLFRQHVGVHCDYDEHGSNGNGKSGTVRPPDQHHHYYDRYPPSEQRDPEGEVVGWFAE